MIPGKNIPINYQIPDVPQIEGAPQSEIAKPGLGLTEGATLYNALTTGTTATVDKEYTRLLNNYVPQSLGGNSERPYLNQEQVNQLWKDNGIADTPIDATKYNDVGVYEMLDDAKRRKVTTEVDQNTGYFSGAGGIAGSAVRGATSLGIGLFDVGNVVGAMLPAGTALKTIGLTKAAVALEAAKVGGVGARITAGAIEGAFGNALIEGVTAPLRSQQGMDYHAADSMVNIGLGAILGGAIHGIAGKNLSEQLSPQVREDALKTSTAQMEEGQFPSVGSVVNGGDLVGDIKTSMQPENNILTHDAQSIPDSTTTNVEYEDSNFDYERHTQELIAKQKEIQDLSDQGLYSKSINTTSPLDNLRSMYNDIKLRSQDAAAIGSTSAGELENIRAQLKDALTRFEEEKDTKYSKWFSDDVIDHEAGAHSVALAAQMEHDFGNDGINLVKSGKVKIVDSVSQLPGKHPDTTQGLFRDGQVYLVADHITPETAKGIVLHEVGVHSADLGTALPEIHAQVDAILQSNHSLDAIVAQATRDVPAAHMAEERLAYLVEHTPELGIIQNYLSKVKAWLFEKFPSLRNALSLTAGDIRNLALSHLRSYARNEVHPTELMGTHYSESIDGAKVIDHEIQSIDDELDKFGSLAKDMLSHAETIVDIADTETLGNPSKRQLLRNYIENQIGSVDDRVIEDLQKNIGAAYARAKEQSLPNPEQYAVKYTTDKIMHGLQVQKTASIYDRAIVKKTDAEMSKYYTQFPKDGLQSKLLGSNIRRPGSRLNTMGDNIQYAKALYQGRFNADMDKAGIGKMFFKGALNDDTTRAMWALEDGDDVSKLSPESVKAAQIIMDIQDKQIKALNDNGFIVNKQKHYITNQKSIHSMEKIANAGYEKWSNDIRGGLDYQAMAENQNIKVSDINDDYFASAYHGLSTGDHIGEHGTVGRKFQPGQRPLSKISDKQRKFIFKNADELIKYRNLYGDKAFQQSILNTLDSTSRKIAMCQTLGINYERNLNEVANNLEKQILDIKQRNGFSRWKNHTMQNMLKSVDGRADIPVSGAKARFFGTWRSINMMAKLGGAAISSLSDITTQARYLNSRGMGGYLYNTITQSAKLFQHFSPEKKHALSALGVFNDSQIRDVYRYGAEADLPGMVSKAAGTFMKLSGLPAWTEHNRLNSLDSLMHYVSGFTDRNMDKLHPATQQEFAQFGIEPKDWDILRQTEQKQIDGGTYLIPEELDNIRDKIKQQTGLSDTATDRYISGLKHKLTTLYLNGVAHMINEPSAFSHFIVTGGTRAGTNIGEITRMVTQFKSFSAEFVRTVLGDQAYQSHDTLGGFLKDWNTKQGLSEKLNMGKFLVASMTFGYMSWTIKSVLSGKTPPALIDQHGFHPAVMAGSLLQGGGAGIYGDFLLNAQNRFGGSLGDTLAGVGVGQLSELYKIYGASLDTAENAAIGGTKKGRVLNQTAKFVKQNTPFLNLFYTRAALDYLFFNDLQEKLNPGYLRRLEQNTKQNNNQQYWMQPTKHTLQKDIR